MLGGTALVDVRNIEPLLARFLKGLREQRNRRAGLCTPSVVIVVIVEGGR